MMTNTLRCLESRDFATGTNRFYRGAFQQDGKGGVQMFGAHTRYAFTTYCCTMR